MNNAPFCYDASELEEIPCNFCGETSKEPLHDRDRNGLAVQTCLCTRCGLIFISPRMSLERYGEYYQKEYRVQLARFKRKPPVDQDYEEAFAISTRHGEALARTFRSEWHRGLTIEVGSSVGGVLNGVRQVLGGEVIGIEPSLDEAVEANRRGIPTHVALFEAFDGQLPPAATIICTQSLNHLLDPRRFLAWAHQNLAEGGRLVLEVMNFRHVFRNYGWIQRAIQIDHTYMFVPEVLEAFVWCSGFDILRLDVDEGKSIPDLMASRKMGLPRLHVRLIAAKNHQRTPFASGEAVPLLYPQVKASLAALPNSQTRYFFKFVFKRRIKRLLRFKGINDKLKVSYFRR